MPWCTVMKADLAAVAVAAPTTPVSSNVLQMARFFAPGAPADDATCVRMMRELRIRESVGGFSLRISEEFSVQLRFLPCGVASYAAEEGESDIECNAYGENEEWLEACFQQSAPFRMLSKIRGRATPDGCRQFLRDVRAAARALKAKGLCPNCEAE